MLDARSFIPYHSRYEMIDGKKFLCVSNFRKKIAHYFYVGHLEVFDRCLHILAVTEPCVFKEIIHTSVSISFTTKGRVFGFKRG